MIDETLKRHKKKFFFSAGWKEQRDFLRSALEEMEAVHMTKEIKLIEENLKLMQQEKRLRLSEDEVRKLLDDLVSNEGLQFQVYGNSQLPTHRKDIVGYIATTICALQNKEKQ